MKESDGSDDNEVQIPLGELLDHMLYVAMESITWMQTLWLMY